MNALTVTNLADDILLFQLVGMYGMLDEHYQTILLVFQKITASSLQLLQSSKSFFPLVFSCGCHNWVIHIQQAALRPYDALFNTATWLVSSWSGGARLSYSLGKN